MRIITYLILSAFITNFAIAQYSSYRVEQDKIEPRHPIDIKYEGKLDFMGGNREMEINILAARDDWRKLLENQKATLVQSLPEPQKQLFIDSQQKWEEALTADIDFFFHSRDRIRYAVGREGEIISKIEFMNRVRKRALDLTEYVYIFVDNTEESNKSE